MELDQTPQLPPWDDGLQFAQEAITPRLLMMSLKTNAGKGHLAHGNTRSVIESNHKRFTKIG